MASEAMKLVFSLCMCMLYKKLNYPVLSSWLEVLLPTLCFLVMNMIAFHCTTLVSASVFVVLMQLKLVFTSLLSYVCLGRSNSTPRWFAIAFVALGCVGATRHPVVGIVDMSDFWWGVGGLLLETVISSGCTVYMQCLLQVDLWMRNVQLAFLSSIAYRVVHSFDPRCSNSSMWGVNDVVLAMLGAFGGIVVAITLRYAGATEKTLSTSMSIVMTSAIDSFITGNPVTIEGGAASLTVVLAVILYSTS
jgi:solute carrier family 35 (UDP-sugar transporter), member A1/2/3